MAKVCYLPRLRKINHKGNSTKSSLFLNRTNKMKGIWWKREGKKGLLQGASTDRIALCRLLWQSKCMIITWASQRLELKGLTRLSHRLSCAGVKGVRTNRGQPRVAWEVGVSFSKQLLLRLIKIDTWSPQWPIKLWLYTRFPRSAVYNQ